MMCRLELCTLLVIANVPRPITVNVICRPNSMFTKVRVMGLHSPIGRQAPTGGFVLVVRRFSGDSEVYSNCIRRRVAMFFSLAGLRNLLCLVNGRPMGTVGDYKVSNGFVLTSKFPVVVRIVTTRVRQVVFRLGEGINPCHVCFLTGVGDHAIGTNCQFFGDRNSVVRRIREQEDIYICQRRLDQFQLVIFLLFLFELFFLRFLYNRP